MTSDILKERGANYGDFHTFANLSQTLYSILITHYTEVETKRNGKAAPLPPFIQESLRMICHKLARIGNGNPYYKDNWVDIAGYAELVVQILDKSAAQIVEATEAALQSTEGKTNNLTAVPDSASKEKE